MQGVNSSPGCLSVISSLTNNQTGLVLHIPWTYEDWFLVYLHTQAIYIFILAWEPTLHRRVIVSPTVYPHFNVHYDFNYFPRSQLRISKLSYKNIPVALPNSLISNWEKKGQGVVELWSDKQTDKQRLQLYIQGVSKKLCSRGISNWGNNFRSIFTIKVSFESSIFQLFHDVKFFFLGLILFMLQPINWA